MQEELLDAKAVAKLLNISYRTVVNMTDRGEIPGFKVGQQWRYRLSDIDAYIQRLIDERKKEQGGR